jgi:hypothetical protein
MSFESHTEYEFEPECDFPVLDETLEKPNVTKRNIECPKGYALIPSKAIDDPTLSDVESRLVSIICTFVHAGNEIVDNEESLLKLLDIAPALLPELIKSLIDKDYITAEEANNFTSNLGRN